MKTKMKKALPAVAILAGTTVGAIGGYFYHEAEANPALQALGTALELITGSEAKAQAAYEATQAELALVQEEILAQEEEAQKAAHPCS